MLTRSGSVISAVIPALFFLFLAIAFSLDAAERRWSHGENDYALVQWMFWFSIMPLGIALLHQIVSVPAKPKLAYLFFSAIVPLSLLPGFANLGLDAVYLAGMILACFSLLSVWAQRDALAVLHNSTVFGRERFWLVIALLIVQTVMAAGIFCVVVHVLQDDQWKIIRNVLGIAFSYIAATSLFRIYPQAVLLKKSTQILIFTKAENDLFNRMENLLRIDKIYQDPSYGRSELARELNTGEANLSRLVNAKYNKTIPQLLNELRVRDAQELLKNPSMSIQNVFEESGFNSLTTFNRVFKELAGETPTQYRSRISL